MIAFALAVVASLVSWLILKGDDDTAPKPQAPRTTQLPAPPIHPEGKSGEKTGSAKPDVRKSEPEKKSEEPGRQSRQQEPRFSFYKILPEKEVIILESEIKTIKREESLGKKPAGNLYDIQAGSFPNIQDAEKMKAQLAGLKVKAKIDKIEDVKLDNSPWYRVTIGPFDSVGGADRVRSFLRENEIDSIVQKVKSK